MSNIMVINMGMKSIRCIIFSKYGLKLGTASTPITTAINDERVEQNPYEWKDKIRTVVKKALWDAGRCEIEYITVTTSASCLVCVDKNGEPLCNAMMVSDKRAEKESQLIEKMAEYQEVYDDTELEMSASLMLPKILWVKNNEEEIFEKTDKFLCPNDYLMFLLTGFYVTDYLNAMKMHYCVEKQEYPLDLLSKLGISSKKMPEVRLPGELVGTIQRKFAEEVGLNVDAKVVLSSYDAICSFWGSGVTQEGEASDVSGTVTVLRAYTTKNTKRTNAIYSIPWFQGDVKIVGGSNNLGGGLIEWVKQCYYANEAYPYEIMENDAAESEICAKGLIFLPYLLGERAPLWDSDARGVFFGLERMHTRKDMTRAVFESTGFIDMDMVCAIMESGVDVESVRLSGGLARINLISHIKADILGKEVKVLSEFETTSTGAAMLALLGQGEYSDIKLLAEKFANIRMIVMPNNENHKKYEYMYELYKETYCSLKDLFIKRKAILQDIRSDKEVRIENL